MLEEKLDEVVDIKPYIDALARNRLRLILICVLAVVVTFGFSSLIPPTYEATALIAVVEPSQIIQFDERIKSVDEVQSLAVYPELAKSDEMMLMLIEQIRLSDHADLESLESLRGNAEASLGSNSNLLYLSAKSQDAEKAAYIANVWADNFVEWTDEIYGNQDEKQMQFFEAQLQEAQISLNIAEERLVDFQSINRNRVISDTLSAHYLTQEGYLTQQRQTIFLIQDVRSFQEQLYEQASRSTMDVIDQMIALDLQMRAINVERSGGVIFQLDGQEPLTERSIGEQIVFLENLERRLETRLEQIEMNLTELEPEILTLQQQKQETEVEYARLIRYRDVAAETYTSLARKVDEERITSDDVSGGIRVASKAAIPQSPVGPRRLIYILVGAVSTFFLAVFWIISAQWWMLYKQG